jgi:hypothetical protein
MRLRTYHIGAWRSGVMEQGEFPATGQVRRCRLRPLTVRFYFNCRHRAALP